MVEAEGAEKEFAEQDVEHVQHDLGAEEPSAASDRLATVSFGDRRVDGRVDELAHSRSLWRAGQARRPQLRGADSATPARAPSPGLSCFASDDLGGLRWAGAQTLQTLFLPVFLSVLDVAMVTSSIDVMKMSAMMETPANAQRSCRKYQNTFSVSGQRCSSRPSRLDLQDVLQAPGLHISNSVSLSREG